MILSDTSILDEMQKGNIVIDPFDEQRLNPASIDLTLGGMCKTFRRIKIVVDDYNKLPDWVIVLGSYKNIGSVYAYYDCLDLKNPNQEYNEFEITNEGFVLVPNKGYLFSCNEAISIVRNLAARVDGKSSLGRYFVKIHETAGFIDPCYKGKLVLEITCTEPIRIYPNIPICQLEFVAILGKVKTAYGEKKTDKYHNQQGVQQSKYYLNFK